MQVTIKEFFALLKSGLTLRSNGPLCGDVCVKKIRGKLYLCMSWPEDAEYDRDALGEYKALIRKPEKIPLKKFERFATRMFYDAQFSVQIADPNPEKEVWKR